ncbi:MAG: hypothetical protein IJ072_05845 [Oscillospiraceae bacterium]|nr:hypothetical protein [Oscillospiraceae bacterium]
MSGTPIEQSSFDRVWQRVVEAQPQIQAQPSAKGGEELLREFMDSTALGIKYYVALYSRLGERREAVGAIVRQQRRELRRLRAAYFILTGKTYAPQTVKARITGTADALRRRYIAEGESAEAYARAAANTTERDISGLFTELARQRKEHQQTLGRILEDMMG